LLEHCGRLALKPGGSISEQCQIFGERLLDTAV
jgi:hypothetical protein